MDDNTFIRYDNLGTVDSHVTCITSLDNVLFLGNSYGDIRLIQGEKSQILHNHHGEITNLVCRRSYRTGRNDSLYLLSGTSIGNVYLHLVFLNKVTGSRILYKFVTGYSVFSICPHPEFDIFNFRRLTNRLTVDFTKEVSKDSNNWKELPSLSISVESFILSLSNGGIYLVYNSNCINTNFSNKYLLKHMKFIDKDNNNSNTGGNNNTNNLLENSETNLFLNNQINDDKERYVIMCISLYSPYSNMKMNWYKRYVCWIDKEGFYIYLLPNFVSILYISSKNFGNFYKKESLGFKENFKKSEKIHYLYNIIDNNELYLSTEESDISLEVEYNRKSSIINNNNKENKNNLNKLSKDLEKNRLKDYNNYYIKNKKIDIKRLRNRFVNHKYLRNNNNYGTMSRFLSESILVGCNNTLVCIKLVEESDEEFEKYHDLLLTTFPNKEVIGYRDVRNSISSRRTSSLVRGYIDFKLVLPEHFNVLHVIYSSQTQFNLIVFDEGPKNLANKDSWQCYLFEKYNRNGKISKYKLTLPEQSEPGNSPREGKSKITNMIFNLSCSEIDDICMINLVHYESISVNVYKSNLLYENIIIGNTNNLENLNKDDVYVCLNNSIIRINYCKNYFNLLSYFINNCYNQNKVVEHFKINLISMLNSNIGCTSLGSDDKGRKYVLDYIGVFVDYILESKYYDGFKIIIEVLNRYGKLVDYFGSVFTPNVRIKLEELGLHDRLVNYLVEIIEEGNSLVYLEIVDWKINDKIYTNLVNKIRTILVNQIYYLYNLYQESELNCQIDDNLEENNYEFNKEYNNNKTNFPNGTYFDVLILLNNLNIKNEINIIDVYNMLYQFIKTTSSSNNQENILKYSLSNKFLYKLNSKNKNKSNFISNNNIKNNMDKSIERLEKNKNIKTNLKICSIEYEEIYSRLLCLKYYYKCLSEKLLNLNTRGLVFPSNQDIEIIKKTESWYIQRAVVNCNICNSDKTVYNKITNKLINKVNGELIEYNKFNISNNNNLESNNILYFSCKHLVHEKCQIRLINQIIKYSTIDISISLINKHNIYDSKQLLDTCLTCLTK